MVPLSPEMAEPIISSERVGRRSLALRNGLTRRLPGFWGDRPRRPSSVVLLREGSGQVDAFAAGDPGPSADWLSRLEGPIALMAPPSWAESIRMAAGSADLGAVESRFRPEGAPIRADRRIPVRRLGIEEGPAFLATAPSWSSLGWDSIPDLIALGAAFCVDRPGSPGFSSLAWIQESAGGIDLLGVWVEPRFRRLGLGLSTALRLLDHVVSIRRSCPLWSLAAENAASRALGRTLGFTLRSSEPLWRWPGIEGPTSARD